MDDMVDAYGFLMILHTVSMASMFFSWFSIIQAWMCFSMFFPGFLSVNTCSMFSCSQMGLDHTFVDKRKLTKEYKIEPDLPTLQARYGDQEPKNAGRPFSQGGSARRVQGLCIEGNKQTSSYC